MQRTKRFCGADCAYPKVAPKDHPIDAYNNCISYLHISSLLFNLVLPMLLSISKICLDLSNTFLKIETNLNLHRHLNCLETTIKLTKKYKV